MEKTSVVKTNGDLAEFKSIAGELIKANPNSKLAYAINKVLKSKGFKTFEDSLDGIIRSHNDKVSGIRIKHASVDSAGNILYENENLKHYKFTPDNLTKVTKLVAEEQLRYRQELREFDDKTQEVEPFCVDLKGLSIDITYVDALSGIILSEETVLELLK